MAKGTWCPKLQKLIFSNQAATVFDSLPLPGSRKISEVSNADLANALIGLGVPGAGHESGRQRNLEAYSEFLDAIKTKAADEAVRKILGGLRDGAPRPDHPKRIYDARKLL